MGVEKKKPDNTEKGLTIFEIDFGAGGNQRRDQARIDHIIQHRQITPVGPQEWLHDLRLRRSEIAATESITNCTHAIADREAFRIGNGTQVSTFSREDPI